VKGVGFGAGFAVAGMSGSENNDAYRIQDGRVVTGTNHAGGVLGGMAAGAALDFTVAFKPPSSIAKPQESVNLCSLENTELRICGRHDPCIAFRGAIAVEAMTVFTIADLLVRGGYHA
jgi:chorismate synthase